MISDIGENFVLSAVGYEVGYRIDDDRDFFQNLVLM